MALSLETGGLGGDPEVTRRLNIAAGQQAIRNAAWRQRREEAAADPASSKPDMSVWQPGSMWRNTGAFRERAMANAQLGAGAKELGAPTSFRGGAGAPEPVGIIRGNTVTFSPGQTPGAQFAGPEFATPTEARQAFNREGANLATVAADRLGITDPRIPAKFGTYKPPEAPALEAASLADVKGERGLNLAKAGFVNTQTEANQQTDERKRQNQVLSDFDKTWKNQYATKGWDTKTGEPTYEFPNDNGIMEDRYAAREFARTNGAQAGMKLYQDRQAVRKYLEATGLPDNFNMSGYLNAVSQDPQAWQQLMATVRNSRPAPPETGGQQTADILGEIGAGY
jgi:hypothetical protein